MAGALGGEESSTTIRRRAVVSGLVQGVFFRDSCRREAERLSVTGWARNEYDGTVVAAFEGEPDSVAQMLEWCRHGPSKAHVQRVDVTAEDPRGDRRFVIE